MAGDWIKMRTDLYRDPKVCLIADALMAPDGELARFVSQNLQREMAVTRNVTRNVTVGALVTVWGVMRQRGKRSGNDLFCTMATLAVIDDMADLPGFGHAMESVGWAVETDNGVVFPHFFDDYNVDPSEQKSTLAAERQRRYRERQKSISDANSNVTRNVTVTHREEKSREENKSSIEQQAARKTPSRFAEFWEAYPVKKGKADAEAKWKARKLDAIADTIIADVKQRIAGDRQWLEGFAPHGSTYVNGRGWEDAIEAPRGAGSNGSTPSYMVGAL